MSTLRATLHLARFTAILAGLSGAGWSAAQDVPAPAARAQCREPVRRHADGALATCTLAGSQVLAGQDLPDGTAAWFRPDGRLARARLGAAVAVLGQPLPEGTELFYWPNGGLRHFWLPVDTELQGHRVRAQDDGAGNRLHPNGRLLAIWLVDDEEIEGVPCSSSGNALRMGLGVLRLGTRRMVWFHDNGRLRQAMLGRDAVIQGHAFTAGTVVAFDREGRLDLAAPPLSAW